MKMTVTAPDDVAWSRLSPRGHEIVRQIGFRAAAGYLSYEIAEMLNAKRPELAARLKHLELPEEINAHWINTRMRELREELVRVSSQ